MNKPDINLAFTKPFNEMLNIIHFAYITNCPIIIEARTGLGKKTAIDYFIKCLKIDNEKIIQIQLSNSTTIITYFVKKFLIKQRIH